MENKNCMSGTDALISIIYVNFEPYIFQRFLTLLALTPSLIAAYFSFLI